jgi:pimeloyl-ACP methyl ester carboxylesterase
MPPMIERDVTAADGRTLRVVEDGDPSGVAVLRHNGTPGSRVLGRDEVATARAHGARLVSYDRPGYGGSDRHEGRTIADCAADVRAVAGALGIERLAVWGISGGGPHALACAAMLEDLVPAVAALASVAPFNTPGLDWLDGMGEDNHHEFGAVLESPAAARRLMKLARVAIGDGDPAAMREAMPSLLSDVDAAVFTGELAADMAAMMHVAMEPGVDGWLDDDLAFVADWGFDPMAIRTPVLVMQGREDRFVPYAHGEWLAAHLPSAEPRLYDTDGHLSLHANHGDELYDWLLERTR